jgi:hypothetical protein
MVPHAFGQAQLLPTMLAFLAQHPQPSLEWILEDRRPDFIAEGIDCAVRVGPVDEPRMVALPLAEVPRIVVAAPSLVQATAISTPEQAQALPWISLVTYYRERLLLHDAQGRAHTLSISPLLSDNLFVVQQAARAGLGAAVVSAWLVADDLARDVWCSCCRTGRRRLPVHVVFPAARQQPPRLRAFIDAMKAALPQLRWNAAGTALGQRPCHPRMAWMPSNSMGRILPTREGALTLSITRLRRLGIPRRHLGLGISQHLVQRSAVIHAATQDHAVDLPGGGDVLQRVGGQQHQIGGLACATPP